MKKGKVFLLRLDASGEAFEIVEGVIENVVKPETDNERAYANVRVGETLIEVSASAAEQLFTKRKHALLHAMTMCARNVQLLAEKSQKWAKNSQAFSTQLAAEMSKE